ncbi:transcriptional regulator [Herbaspirillum sp. CF444]|uniref:IclR family transcriptional regulator n=1 Tax=Herbaspirillum sp. CF444 TaxID=1144319 RepID=UPI0002726E17|nr:IclR family transcriptional regulator [Herbaspirillum sp. CF444]EJL92850.1 transcriptional regulator [Herbaspirillum sp. CF444]
MARTRETAQPPLGIEPSGVDVLDRAAAILFAFKRDEVPLTLTEISNRTGLYKSTALRLLGALCHHRLLMRVEDGRYLLGAATLNLAATYESTLDLADVLLPLMRQLNENSGESVSFHVRDGNQRVCLYRISSRHALRAEVQPGDVLPLDRGASGRVLSAFSGADGEPYETVRITLHYMSMGERDAETAGISAPVFGAGGSLVGAIGLVGPVSRLNEAAMHRFRPLLLSYAAQATNQLGGDPKALLAAATNE